MLDTLNIKFDADRTSVAKVLKENGKAFVTLSSADVNIANSALYCIKFDKEKNNLQLCQTKDSSQHLTVVGNMQQDAKTKAWTLMKTDRTVINLNLQFAAKVEEKPAQTPQVEEKPAQTPQVEEKPAQTPQVEEKPAQTPQVEEKPAQTPQVEEKKEETKVEEKTESKPIEYKPGRFANVGAKVIPTLSGLVFKLYFALKAFPRKLSPLAAGLFSYVKATKLTYNSPETAVKTAKKYNPRAVAAMYTVNTLQPEANRKQGTITAEQRKKAAELQKESLAAAAAKKAAVTKEDNKKVTESTEKSVTAQTK